MKFVSSLTALVVALLTLPSTGLAARNDSAPALRVLKVKGNRATVVFSKKKNPLVPGMTGSLVENDSEEDEEAVEMRASDSASKDNFIGLEGGFSVLKQTINGVSDSSSTIRLDLSVLYGWNTGTFEFGPLVNFAYRKTSLADAKTYELGGLADYNFNPNDMENPIVYSLRLVGAVGQVDNSTQVKSATTFRIEPGFVIKWFGLDSNLAMLASLNYTYQSQSLDTAKSSTSGVVMRFGIQNYF